MESRKKYLTVADGSRLFYEIYGQGEPLFLLHGNGNDGSYFAKQIAALKHRYQLFVIDSRGQGASTNQAQQITFSIMADDLKAIMEKEQITRADLLGFSDGANLAMMFAYKYPDRVDRMILNAGNLTVSGLKTFWLALTYLQYFLCWLLALVFTAAKKKLPVIGLMIHDIGLSKHDLTTIASPTLVIVGKKDVIKLTHTLMIVHQLPHATFVLVPKQGHRLAQTDAENFNREVVAFLGGEKNDYP